MQKIIGVSGQMRMGKDTVADYLALKLDGNWQRVAFAAGVKRVFTNTFGEDAAFIEKWKVIKEAPEGFKKSVRQALQFIGDGFREIKENIWIDLLFRTENPPMIISDVRYVNELCRIKSEDGLNILVWRPGYENDDPNGSEAQTRPLIDYFSNLGIEGPVGHIFKEMAGADLVKLPRGVEFVDYFIKNDGNLEFLYKKIDEVLVPYVKRKFE